MTESMAGGGWCGRLVLMLVLVLGCAAGRLEGQSRITASRAGDLQVGGAFVFGKSNYGQPYGPTTLSLKGGSIYATFDFKAHYGVEAEVHQVSASEDSTIYERTYEVGARYHRTYGRFLPYAKVMIGRGVFNYQQNIANVAYNLYAGGVGTDFRLRPSINLRAEYEYQQWISFPLVQQHPGLASIGIAYHFHE